MVKRIKVKSYLRKVKGRKRRVRVKAYTRRKPTKRKEKRIRVKSYLRKVKGRKRRIRVRAYTRRRPEKRKKKKIKPEPEPEEEEEEEEEEESPEITEEDIDHWVESKNFADRSKTIRALIEAHGSQNAFYRALQDWAKHREL